MRKRIGLLLLLIILLLTTPAFAEKTANVSCNVEKTTESKTEVTFKIRDNPGLASWMIELSWDNTSIQYNSISYGSAFEKGTFLVNDNVPGKLSVIWFSATNVTEDAPMFSLSFSLIDKDEGDYHISVSHSAADTVNEKGETVALKMDNSVDLQAPGIDNNDPVEGENDPRKENPLPPSTDHSAERPVFSDVKESDYFFTAVNWAVNNQITSGVSETEFGPDAPCTRAQAVTFLWRMAGAPKPSLPNNSFTDVKSNQYYYQAVLWAVENEITLGTSTTAFSPNDPVTRGQLVTFLWRYAGKQNAAGGKSFDDVKESDYFAASVQWAVRNGITLGTGNGLFSPNATCIRGQTVTFLYRFVNPQKTI